MKLSEFINQLNSIYEKEGDLLVVTPTPISTKNEIGADLPPVLEVDENLLIIHSEEYTSNYNEDITEDDLSEVIDVDEETEEEPEEEFDEDILLVQEIEDPTENCD